MRRGDGVAVVPLRGSAKRARTVNWQRCCKANAAFRGHACSLGRLNDAKVAGVYAGTSPVLRP